MPSPVTYVGTCHACKANNIGMTYVAYARKSEYVITIVFSCNGCQSLTCVPVNEGEESADWVVRAGCNLDEAASYANVEILQPYPAVEPVRCPEHIPPAVERALRQGIDNAARRQNDAAAAMFRKALDVATRTLDESLSDRNLAPRIDALCKAGKLTQDLKEWAHVIRLDGNHGAHDDDELDGAQIAQLASFTELFLTYTFTLPVQVALRKSATDGALH